MNGELNGQSEQALLEELRRELLGPDRHRLGQVEEELKNPERFARHVAAVLPRAVKASSQKDKKLAWALEPTLEASIRENVREHPKEFAEALYPIMGPSIARAIKSAIAEMLQRINQAMSTRVSIESVR